MKKKEKLKGVIDLSNNNPRVVPSSISLGTAIRNPFKNQLIGAEELKNDNSWGGDSSGWTPTYDSWNCIVDSSIQLLNDDRSCGDYLFFSHQ